MGSLREVSIEITNRCSMNCIHCSSEAGEELTDELSLGEILSIIDQTKSLGGSVLTLSGGDPILRADLFDIIGYARGCDFDIRLQTSGAYDFGEGTVPIPYSHLDAFLEKMNPNDRFVYSVLGLQSTHERMTSKDLSFERVMDSIRRTKEKGINVEVHTVPNGLNCGELSQMADLLEAEGVDSWHLLRLVPQGRCSEHPELGLSIDQFRELQQSIAMLCERDSRMELRLGHNIDRRYWSEDSYSATQCQMGAEKMLIRVNGDVTYCAALKHQGFGNIRENTISYFWKEHPFVREVRYFLESGFQEMTGKCGSCEILNDCRGGCVAQRLYYHKYLNRGPDPLCYRKPTEKR